MRLTNCLRACLLAVAMTAAGTAAANEATPFLEGEKKVGGVETAHARVLHAGGLEEIEVTAVEKDGDDLVATRKGIGENNSRYTKIIVSPKGLRQPQDVPNDKPEQWVLKCGLKAGESWDTPSGKRTASGPEEVKVPAGTFQALRVVWEGDGEGLTSWYAPGVGEVKRVMKRNGKEAVTRSLYSFSPGK